MDEVFKALADPSRRTLLDTLFEEDGQTLSALEGRLPMTRFGVMKHLKVLEGANLVTTRKRGREKLHFLNPVPIRLVHDRWVSKYAEPWAAALSDLKKDIETKENVMEKVFEIYIHTTPERLWEAITDGTTMRVLVGPDYDGELPESSAEQVEADPPRRLVQRMVAEWSEEVKREGPSRITWEIEPVGTSCRLTVTHDELREGANDELYGGWTMILSALKSYLETGEYIDTPATLRFAALGGEQAG
jgi:DNA-binding transcriptional ArsR family regulator